MMHAILSGMHLAVTSALDQREHLVDEGVFATSITGHWTARCGALVVSAALEVPPAGRCVLCDPPIPTRRRARSMR